MPAFEAISELPLSQEYGIFYLKSVVGARVNNNAFEYNAAEIGTAYYLEDTTIYGSSNVYYVQPPVQHPSGSAIWSHRFGCVGGKARLPRKTCRPVKTEVRRLGERLTGGATHRMTLRDEAMSPRDLPEEPP